jgi:hypothetical protein
MTVMRTIPVPMVKKDIYINVRGIVNIRSWNHYYWRWLVDNYHWGVRRNNYLG